MSRAKSFSEETFEEAFEDTPLHHYLRLIVILVFVEKDVRSTLSEDCPSLRGVSPHIFGTFSRSAIHLLLMRTPSSH